MPVPRGRRPRVRETPRARRWNNGPFQILRRMPPTISHVLRGALRGSGDGADSATRWSATGEGLELERLAGGGSVRRDAGGGAGLRGGTPVGLAGGGRRRPGRRRGHRHRGDLAEPGPRRGRATGAGDRLPGGRAGPGPAVRRRGAVPRVRSLDGARRRGTAPQAAGLRVRRRVSDHRSAQPGRHDRAAHPGGIRHRRPPRGPAQAARVRLHPPVEHRLAAAAGLQPDQPAGLRRQRAELPSLRRPDGAAVADRDRHRIRGLPAVLRHRPGRRRPGPARRRAARGAGVRAGHGGVHASGLRRDLRARAQPRVGGPRPARSSSRPAPWPSAAPPPRPSCARRPCRSSPSSWHWASSSAR